MPAKPTPKPGFPPVTMDNLQVVRSLLVFAIFPCSLFLIVTAKSNHHGHAKEHSHPISEISAPPSSAPKAAPGPSSDDEPDGQTGVFDVRKFGAAGDGATDDTDAFKMAWDSACGAEGVPASTVLVPRGHSFMIQSTIFTGPCKPGIVFQVTVLPL